MAKLEVVDFRTLPEDDGMYGFAIRYDVNQIRLSNRGLVLSSIACGEYLGMKYESEGQTTAIIADISRGPELNDPFTLSLAYEYGNKICRVIRNYEKNINGKACSEFRGELTAQEARDLLKVSFAKITQHDPSQVQV